MRKFNAYLRVLPSRWALVALTLAGIAANFVQLSIVGFGIAGIIGAVILGSFIKNIGFITASLISYVLLTCLQQVFGVAYWLFDTHFTLDWFATIILAGQLIFILANKSLTTWPESLRINRSDLISLAVAGVSIVVITFGLLRGGESDNQLVRFMTRGFDSSTHLSLIMSVYDNKGYVYGPHKEVHDRLVFTALTSYPQGWHLSTSTIWHAIDKSLSFKDTTKLVAFFFVTSLTWYFLLIFLVTRISVEVANRISKKKLPVMYALGGLLLMSFLLQAALTIGLLRYGFVNYIALISYLLLIVLLTFWMYSKKISAGSYAVVGALLSTSSAFTWLLAAPIGFVLVIAGILFRDKRLDTRKYLMAWKTHSIITAAFLVLGVVALVQVYIQIRYSTIPDNITNTTIIWSTNRLFMTILLGAILSFIFFYKPSYRWADTRIAVLAVTLGSVLVPALIYLYLFLSAGSISYYSEKISIIPAIIFTSILAGLGVGLLGNLAREKGYLIISSVIFVTVLSFPLLVGLDLKELKFAVGRDWTTSQITSQQVIQVLSERKISQGSVFIAKEYNYEEDVIVTHFMNAISQKETKCTSLIGWYQMIRSSDLMASEIRRCAQANPKVPYTIIASKKTQRFWERELSDVKSITILVQD